MGKILKMILAIALSFVLLPIGRPLQVEAASETIQKASLAISQAPATGASVDGVTFTRAADSGFKVSSVTWAKKGSTDPVSLTDIFAADQVYTATVNLTAIFGYLFPTDVSSLQVELTGIAGISTADTGSVTVSNGGGTLSFTVTFAQTGSGLIQGPIQMSVSKGPENSALENTVAFTVGSGFDCSVGAVTWDPAVSYIFAGGTVYTASVTLAAGSGKTFDPSDTIALTRADTGAAIDVTAPTFSEDHQSLTFKAVFPITSTVPPVIYDASLTINQLPAAGGSATGITIAPKEENAGFTVDSYTWSPDPQGGTFASGTSYTASVTLKAAAGKTFGQYVSVSLYLGTELETATDVVISSDRSTLTFTALASRAQISEISATLNKKPQIGGSVSNVMFIPVSGSPYNMYISWIDPDTQTYLSDTDHFEDGKAYTARVNVSMDANGSSEFAASPTLSLSDADGSLTYTNFTRNSATNVSFDVAFSAPTESVTVIKDVPVHFSVGPDVGNTPSALAIDATDQFSVQSISLIGNITSFNYSNTYSANVILTPKSGYEFDYYSLLNLTFSGSASAISAQYVHNNVDAAGKAADSNLFLSLRITTSAGGVGQTAATARQGACSISYANTANPLYKISCNDSSIISRSFVNESGVMNRYGTLLLFPLDAGGNADLTKELSAYYFPLPYNSSEITATSVSFHKSDIGYYNTYDSNGNVISKNPYPNAKYKMVLKIYDDAANPTAEHYYLISGSESVLFGTNSEVGYTEENIDKTSCRIEPVTGSTVKNSAQITCSNSDAMKLLTTRLNDSSYPAQYVHLVLNGVPQAANTYHNLPLYGEYNETTGIYSVSGDSFSADSGGITAGNYSVELQIEDAIGYTHYYQLSDSFAVEATKTNPGTVNASFDSTTGDLVFSCNEGTDACKAWVAEVEKTPGTIFLQWAEDGKTIHTYTKDEDSTGTLSASSSDVKVVYNASYLAKLGLYPASGKTIYYSFYSTSFNMIKGIAGSVPDLPVYSANTPHDLKGTMSVPAINSDGNVQFTCTPADGTVPDDAQGCIAFADSLTRFWGIETDPSGFNYNGSISADYYTVTKDAATGVVTYILKKDYYKTAVPAETGTFKFELYAGKFNQVTTGTVYIPDLNTAVPADTSVSIMGSGIAVTSANSDFITKLTKIHMSVVQTSGVTISGNAEEVFTPASSEVLIQTPAENGTQGNLNLYSALIPIDALLNHDISRASSYAIFAESTGYVSMPSKVYNVSKILNLLNAAKEIQRNAAAVTTDALANLDAQVADLDSANVSTVVSDSSSENVSLTGVGSLAALSDTEGKLSSADLGKISGASDVAVNVNVSSDTLTAAETSSIKSLVGSDAMLDSSFNVEVTKQVDSAASTEVKELCAPGAITFDLSEDTQKALATASVSDASVVLVREHETTDAATNTTTTELSVLPVTVSADGKTATAYSDKFSGFTPVVLSKTAADSLVAKSAGNTISGTVNCWMDMSSDMIRLYPGTMSDTDIRADMLAFTPSKYTKAIVSITDVTAPAISSKTVGVQSFVFKDLTSGSYKVAAYTAGGNTIRVSPAVTISDTSKTIDTGALKQWVYGDVNNSGKIELMDAIEVIKYYLKRDNAVKDIVDNDKDTDILLAVNVNSDSTVNLIDAIEILKKFYGRPCAIDNLK